MSEGIERLADEIRSIAKSARELQKSSIKTESLLLLIQIGIPTRDRPTLKQIKLVLDAAADLEREHLK